MKKRYEYEEYCSLLRDWAEDILPGGVGRQQIRVKGAGGIRGTDRPTPLGGQGVRKVHEDSREGVEMKKISHMKSLPDEDMALVVAGVTLMLAFKDKFTNDDVRKLAKELMAEMTPEEKTQFDDGLKLLKDWLNDDKAGI